MKTIYKLSFIGCLIISLGATSCDDFLSEPPSKTTSLVITSTAQLDAVLSTYTDFWVEQNRAAVVCNDDFSFSTAYYDTFSWAYYDMGYVAAGLGDYETLIKNPRDKFWTGEWSKIFRANMVLQYVDKVSGTEADKSRLKTEAHFVRAYSYWGLANTYCLPYADKNKQEPGLPLKSSTNFEESMARATLEDTYLFIEADIQEALKCKDPLVQSGIARHWRANTAGVHGFAARYYLNKNDYTKALEQADHSLSEYNRLVDYNTEMRYANDVTVTINAGTPQSEKVIIQYPYTQVKQGDHTDRFEWKEHLYLRFLYDPSWNYIPTSELLGLYDQDHDLRYRYHIVEHHSYWLGATRPAYDYPGYVFFFVDQIPNGPSTSEMYLIKAECQARLGDYNAGISTLNELRAKRFEQGAWVNLSATSKEDAIKKILEERRREKPFTLRWYDLRRFNNNEDPNDDVVVTKTFYKFNSTMIFKNEAPITYTLEKDSRKYALPIFNTDIQSSNGVLKQNTY